MPKKLFSISHWCGPLLLLLLPKAVHKGLHGCLGLSRIRDWDWAPGSPWAMDRAPRGGLVSPEILCLLSLPWASLLFTAASQPGKSFSKSVWFLSVTLHCWLLIWTLHLFCCHRFVLCSQEEQKKAYLAFVLGKAKLKFFLWCWKKLFTDFKTKSNWSECWVITSRFSLK